MKLRSETIFDFNASTFNIIHTGWHLRESVKPYGEMLDKVKEEVGEEFDFTDAQSLCLMGFFVTHRSFNVDESMHAYGNVLYYEDGARVSISNIDDKDLQPHMRSGWLIKVSPDKVDFDMLKEMHENNMDKNLNGVSYESCLKCPVEELESDWYDDIIDCAYRKNQIWLRKTNPLMEELNKVLLTKSHKTIVLWSLSLANEVRDKLSHEVYTDKRPRIAIESATDWAFGRCKMKQARKDILSCHAVCKDNTSEIDSLYCHAIGQACSTVHTPKHALGLPMYELTAIGKLYGLSYCKDAILERYSHYINKLEFCETQVDKYAGWAQFMS